MPNTGTRPWGNRQIKNSIVPVERIFASADHHYNIQGQLTSIKNGARTNDVGVSNYRSNNVFGMETALYETGIGPQ